MVNCAKCGHPEPEHAPLGCRHEHYTELRTEDAEGVTTHSDLSFCECPYFQACGVDRD